MDPDPVKCSGSGWIRIRILNADGNTNCFFIFRCDQLLSFYRTNAKTIRWYKRIFYHLVVDLCLANAFLLFRTRFPGTTLFDYRLMVAKSLLAGQPRRKEAAVEQEQAGLRNITVFGAGGDPAPGVGAIGQPNDGIGHLPDYVARIPKCCARKGCKKRSHFWCIKCRKYLCLMKGRNCFVEYHQ